MNIDHYNEVRRQEHLRRHDLWRDAYYALREIHSRVLAFKNAELYLALLGIDAAMDLLNGFRLGLCQKITEEFGADGAAKTYPYSHDLKSLAERAAPPYATPLDCHRGVADQYHRFASAVVALARRVELDYRANAPIVPDMFDAIGTALFRLRAGLESLIPDQYWNGPDADTFRRLYESKHDEQAVDPRSLILEHEAERMLGLPHKKRQSFHRE